MYISTDDIKNLVDLCLANTDESPDDIEIRNQYGYIRGYLNAIQDILTKDKENG